MVNKRVTIQDIANSLGVAKSTVSKALSNATDISEHTRNRVLDKTKELGYLQKSQNEPNKKKVLMITYSMNYNDIDNFAYELLTGFQSQAKKSKCDITFMSVNEQEMKTGSYTEQIDFSQTIGCFFVGFRPHMNFLSKIEKNGVHAVILDHNCSSEHVSKVGSDNYYGINLAVSYLTGLGHKRIGFLGGEKSSDVTIERKIAFDNAMHSINRPHTQGFISYASFTHKFTFENIAPLLDNRITALVCASDHIAVHAINLLKEHGISVPQDISVIGYDDLPIAQTQIPSVTSIRQDRLKIGKAAFKTLLQLNAGFPISQMLLRPEIVVRESATHLIQRENKNASNY